MSEATISLRKHIADLWKAAAELRIAAADEAADAAALRRMAEQLEVQADELEESSVARDQSALFNSIPLVSPRSASALLGLLSDQGFKMPSGHDQHQRRRADRFDLWLFGSVWLCIFVIGVVAVLLNHS